MTTKQIVREVLKMYASELVGTQDEADLVAEWSILNGEVDEGKL